VFEREDAVVVKAELPGLTVADVDVEIDDTVLTISGERTFTDTVDTDRYHRIERSYGTFRRSITLPQGIEGDAVQARFADGVLEVTVPKAVVPQPRKITIQTGVAA
jgi:HSP20 family protein